MKVICDRGALSDALNLVGSVVPSRSPSPVLLCVKLTARDDKLIVAATDLEVGIRLGVDQVDIQEEGEALIPADKFSQIVRASDDATLTLETDNHALNIRGADAHFKVFGYDPAEAPAIRDFEGTTVTVEIESGTLQTMISRTLFAAATEHSRYAINGVLFDRDDRNLRLIATDGRRLALARGTCHIGEGKSTTIIPTKALSLLSKLIDDPETPIYMVIEDNQVLFKVGDGPDCAILSSNLVEGAFPPFEDVIPKDHDKRVTFESGTLASAIRRAALLTNEESKGVRLSFHDNKLTLSSRAPEMGEAEIQLDLKDYTGEPLDIGFNPGFITDALKVVGNSEVIIELKAANKPGVLKTGNDFTYVIMPVNLQ